VKGLGKVIKKAIIMAGGSGTRLRPSTLALNKHLIPIYDKPLIYYPLSLLMLIGIRDILIIVNDEDEVFFKKLIGNGEKLGIKIRYKKQLKPAGIPDAFIIGEDFIKNENVILILGDNIFYGQGLIEIIKKSKNTFKNGAKIFTYPVKKPNEFGVVELKNNKISKLVEKPKVTNSNLAITGLYFFDEQVYNISKNLIPSKRNETEIIEVLKQYKKKKRLSLTKLGRGSAWLDTGTVRNNLLCSNFIQIIEDRQNYKIGCIEEIAFKKKWISKRELMYLTKNLGNNEYSNYLKSLLI
jgi:glucose-1-phosphate thymidylyltransferase